MNLKLKLLFVITTLVFVGLVLAKDMYVYTCMNTKCGNTIISDTKKTGTSLICDKCGNTLRQTGGPRVEFAK